MKKYEGNILVLESITEYEYTDMINKKLETNPEKEENTDTVIFYAVSDKLPKGYIWQFMYEDASGDGVSLYHTKDKQIFDQFVTSGRNTYINEYIEWNEIMYRGYDEKGNYYCSDELPGSDKDNYLEYAKRYSEYLSKKLKTKEKENG